MSRPHQLREVRLPNLNAGAIATQLLASPRFRISLSLWGFGLALLFLVPGLPVSPAALSRFHEAMPLPRHVAAEREAHRAMLTSEARFEASRGWFWSCDAACAPLREDARAARAAWQVARDRIDAAATAARGHLGVWSTHGVEAAREAFWNSFSLALASAKRASFWDLLFYGVRAQFRDEGMAEFLLRMFLRVMYNITFSVLFGVLRFFYLAYGVVRDYNAGFLSGLAFFALCLLAGASFFALTVLVTSAVTIGTVGGAVYMLQNAAREQQRRREHLHNQ